MGALSCVCVFSDKILDFKLWRLSVRDSWRTVADALDQTMLLATYFEFSETCILLVCGSVAAVDDEIPNCARVKYSLKLASC